MAITYSDTPDADTDADTLTWASVVRASGFDAFAATPTSANLRALITDETGSGSLVFATSPTLVTPALGTPASGVLTNCTGLPNASVVGLGTAALKNTGTSGNTVPLLDGANTWSGAQIIAVSSNTPLTLDGTGSQYQVGRVAGVVKYYTGTDGTSWLVLDGAAATKVAVNLSTGAITAGGAAVATAGGSTGGSGSGGAGNQYVALNIGGTVYKLLHDGTI